MKLGGILAGLILCVIFTGVSFAGMPEGVIAHWRFNEGSGATAFDATPNGHDGVIRGARYVPHGDGYALEFDGTGEHVDFGEGPGLEPGDEFTLEMWMNPCLEKEGYSPSVIMGKTLRNFALTFNPHTTAVYLFVSMGNSMGGVALGRWNHVVGVFNEDEARIYINARESYHRRRSGIDNSARRDAGAPFLIGASTPEEPNPEAAGRSFKGKIAEAVFYGRALGEDEIKARYAGSNLTGEPGLQAAHVPPLELVAADVDTQPLGELPPGAVLSARLVRGGTVLSEERVDGIRSRTVYPVEFAAGGLEPGVYRVEAEVGDAVGGRVGRASSEEVTVAEDERFPEEIPYGRRLNNLVTEYIDARGADAGGDIFRFHREREGWTFVRARLQMPEGSGVELICRHPDGSEERLISARSGETPPAWSGEGDTWEAMRHLPAGGYELEVRAGGGARVEKLVVRAVPELMLNNLARTNHTRDGAERGPEYYATRGLRYCNSVFNAARAAVPAAHRPFVEQWQEAGRKVYVNARLPIPTPNWPEEKMTVEDVSSFWLEDYYAEGLDGIVCDEIHWRTQHAGVYAGAAREFHRRTGASVGIYTGEVFRYPAWEPFLNTAVNSGGHLLWERYFTDHPTTLRAWLSTRYGFNYNTRGWNEVMSGLGPDLVPRTVMLLGAFTLHHRRTHHIWPQADWNVYMDMRFNAIANDPEYDGIGGVSVWRVNYLEEERVVWIGELYRHYFIEGRRDMLSGRSYLLTHIQNPGFEAGLDGWTVSEAERGAVRADESPGFGTVLGLAPPVTGDEVAVMRRCFEKPNKISQTLTGLTPGDLYAVTMVAADFNDIAVQQEHAVRIDIAGGERVDGESYRRLFTNQVWRSVLYPERNSAWMTYYRKVFRALGEEAELVVSDWESSEEPGGSTGQETMIGYVQVRPYLDLSKFRAD